jgi:hypothetical protein
LVSRGGRAAGEGGRYLLVLGDDSMITRTLPPSGEIVLGRDAECDPSRSRRPRSSPRAH